MNPSAATTALEGNLGRITFYNEDSHFTIARFRPATSEKTITVLGTLPNPNPGETLKITGTWETNRRYGEQFRIQTVEVVMPATVDGIKRYLESGFIRGIGPKTAARLVKHFQEKTLEIIETAPHRLTEVKGIGPANAENIVQAWFSHHAIRGLMRFLQECGVKTAYGAKIYKLYGPEAVDVIREDPFTLAEDIPGIGFYIADAIARHYGIIIDEDRRIRACILHLLRQAVDDGHLFRFADQLAKQCVSKFEISTESFLETLQALEADGEIVTVTGENPEEPSAVYPKHLYEAEAGIARKLLAMLSVPVSIPDIDPEDILCTIMQKLAVQLSGEQVSVLKGVMDRHIAIVTGGPGTGKTTLIRSLTAIFEQTGKEILLAAPTGRAARRLGEVTGRKAATIHKLLGYSPQTGLFDKDQDAPLTADVVIIDEASMVDTLLMFHLMQAIHMRSRLILVGDVSQLPSVGAGNVLSDLIKSEKIQTFELKEIFRQAHLSPIIVSAHHIREGVKPEFAGDIEKLSECSFIVEKNPEIVVQKVIDLCRRRIPEQFGLDPVRDIQVITPMHRGLVGTIHLNQVLQKALNPAAGQIKIMDDVFKPGDKVMQLKNDYLKEVFNGDIGTILTIDKEKDALDVDFDGRCVSYDLAELDDLSLAYAISVHKSQGSEYPAVIIPLLTHHYPLLQRNLLYTAVSRGKHLVVLIGTPKAFAIALNNNRPQHRLSGLADRLCGR